MRRLNLMLDTMAVGLGVGASIELFCLFHGTSVDALLTALGVAHG